MKYHCRPDGTNLCMGLTESAGNVEDVGLLTQIRQIPRKHIFLKDSVIAGAFLGGSDGERHGDLDGCFEERIAEWTGLGKPRRRDV